MSTPTEYKGETKTRSPRLATILSFVAPGLGLLYVGDWIKAMAANLGFIALLEAFLILFAAIKFFPALPLLVLMLTWVTYVGFCARAARRSITDQDYLLRGFNHPLVYAGFAMLTFAAPALASLHFATSRLVSVVSIDDAGMIPTLRPGDVALIDLTAFQQRLPARGELVAVRNAGKPMILRAVAGAGDSIRFEGDIVFVNEEPLPRAPIEITDSSEIMNIAEGNGDREYPLAFSPRVHNYAVSNVLQIPDEHCFALADNRSLVPADSGAAQTRDSRTFGPIDRAGLVGKPLFIAWSTDPASGNVRWKRIGLRVR